jgi:hypothetical protein
MGDRFRSSRPGIAVDTIRWMIRSESISGRGPAMMSSYRHPA